MKGIFFVAVCSAFSMASMQACENKFSNFDQFNDDFIVGHIFPWLSNKDLSIFSRTSKAIPALTEKYWKVKMLEQRKMFISKFYDDPRMLNLNDLGLTVIYPGVFDAPEFKEVKWLYLGNNNLYKLHPKIFSPLKSLELVGLNGNNLIQLHPEIFKELKNLKDLYLNCNKLTALDPKIFSGLKNLETIFLNGNQLSHFDPHMYKDFKNLKEVIISGNPFLLNKHKLEKCFFDKELEETLPGVRFEF